MRRSISYLRRVLCHEVKIPDPTCALARLDSSCPRKRPCRGDTELPVMYSRASATQHLSSGDSEWGTCDANSWTASLVFQSLDLDAPCWDWATWHGPRRLQSSAFKSASPLSIVGQRHPAPAVPRAPPVQPTPSMRLLRLVLASWRLCHPHSATSTIVHRCHVWMTGGLPSETTIARQCPSRLSQLSDDQACVPLLTRARTPATTRVQRATSRAACVLQS